MKPLMNLGQKRKETNKFEHNAPPKKKVALTIAQQISLDAPFHPQAKHGFKEMEQQENIKHEEPLMNLSKLSASIVDGWMKDMIKGTTKKDIDKTEAYQVPEELLMRQPR